MKALKACRRKSVMIDGNLVHFHECDRSYAVDQDARYVIMRNDRRLGIAFDIAAIGDPAIEHGQLLGRVAA